MHVDQMSQPFLGLSSWSCSVRCGNSNSQISWVQVARHIPQDSFSIRSTAQVGEENQDISTHVKHITFD